MAENFYLDNADLARYLDKIDLSEVVAVLEDGYRYAAQFPDAPRHYADAIDNYRQLLTLLGEIAASRIAPRAAEAAEEGCRIVDGRVVYARASQEALDSLRQAELMAAMLPREYGGLNLPETVYQMMIEVVSRADAGLMTLFGLQEVSATIAEYGDPATKDRLLPRFARGEVTGAMVLTEPDAGSDLGAIRTRATFDPDCGCWRLRGVKRFITNGGADVLVVLARSEPDSADARGLSLFAVEADGSVHVRRLEHKMGLTASPTCEIEFLDTPAMLVGRPRFGLIRYAMSMMNGARLAVAAQAVGIAEAAYREALRYAEKRIQFGRPIIELPAVYRMLLSMRCQIEAMRALAYEAGRWVDNHKALERLKDRGALPPDGRERLRRAERLAGLLTPMAKYYATEMGNHVCYLAVQVHGGAGYMREFQVERLAREMRVTSIYEGTSQLQVVAAVGGLLGHALDEWLAERAALETPSGLAERRQQLEEATAWLGEAADRLHDSDSATVDYYAEDLMDLAVAVVAGWLVLEDARTSERKALVAEVFLAEVLPRMRAWTERLRWPSQAPGAARDEILYGDGA